MCLGSPKPPPAPAVAAAPTREQVEAANRSQAQKDAATRIKTVQDQAKLDATRQGIYGNIKSSPTGDTGYGKHAFFGGAPMKLGSAAAAYGG